MCAVQNWASTYLEQADLSRNMCTYIPKKKKKVSHKPVKNSTNKFFYNCSRLEFGNSGLYKENRKHCIYTKFVNSVFNNSIMVTMKNNDINVPNKFM